MSLVYKKEEPKIYTHKDRLKHQSWCLSNDIKIYFQTTDGWNYGKIMINEKGKLKETLERFKQLPDGKNARRLGKKEHKWANRIFELYTEYYLKYNKNEN